MKTRTKFIIAFVAGILGLSAVLVFSEPPSGASPEDAKISQLQNVKFNPRELQSGDLVFRNGDSFMSDRIVALSPEGVNLSHVGIIIREENRLYVVHIIGDHFKNYVRKDSLKSFVENSVPEHLCVTRYSGSDQTRLAIAETALNYFRERRGFDYDMTLESEDELFCTELAWRAVLDATGKDVSPEKVPWRGKILIGFMPFFRGPHFEPVYLEKKCPVFQKSAAIN